MKNKRLILLIIGILALCTVIIYTTYSFFVASVNQNTGGTTIQSGNFNIVYNKGTDIIGGVLTPSINKNNGLNTSISIKKNSSSLNAKYQLLLTFSLLDDELKSKAFKWELYRGNEENSISSGDFENTIVNSPTVLLTEEVLSLTETTYTLFLWLDGNLTSNEIQNKNFLASLKVETYQINK